MFLRKFAGFLALCSAILVSPAAVAQLPVGTKVPNIATQGALAGKTFKFDLKKALKKGPVVLYFFPKAFTQGCTLEARAFAEAMDDFQKAGATVVGMSADDIDTLKRFSTEECRNSFAVAKATPGVIKAFDVALVNQKGESNGLTKRTSYVIGTDGRIKLSYTDMGWSEHVKRTLAKVQELKRN